MAATVSNPMPTSLSNLFTPKLQDICSRCKQAVYQAEKTGPVNRRFFHKMCFKCVVCGQHLTMKTYFTHMKSSDEMEIYCTHHLPKSTVTGIDGQALGILNAMHAPKAFDQKNVLHNQARPPQISMDAMHIMQPVAAQSRFQKKYQGNNEKHHFPAYVVICDGDLAFIDCIVRWPGSVHDSRILRESDLFAAFESEHAKPLEGLILGDSGYMLRDWLLTPILNPITAQEVAYNVHHKAARSQVERSIGILKRRWHCLRRLRLQPVRACNVITACIILHNRARNLQLEDPSDTESESDSEGDDDADYDAHADAAAYHRPENYARSERVRAAVGKAARQRIVNNYFA